MTCFPDPHESWKDYDLAKKWELLLKVRSEVTKSLENARVEKLIGHPLDAWVTVSANQAFYNILKPYEDELKNIFIVSQTSLVEDDSLTEKCDDTESQGLLIQVHKAKGSKCERCWVYDTSVGDNSEHASACNRCIDVLGKIKLSE
jgi:isoleucyl-tRNA synthetase